MVVERPKVTYRGVCPRIALVKLSFLLPIEGLEIADRQCCSEFGFGLIVMIAPMDDGAPSETGTEQVRLREQVR